MVGMMNTVNLIDGVDGLAGGIVAITAICITLISWRLGQYTIAILAAIFTGAILGFLLHNWNPSRIIMGDSGSQFLGIGLAVLSIMGGAKLALALMVLGLPILDVAVVVINRVRRGQSPVHYDTTHLHHRLKATGLSARQICYLFYAFTAFFGILALNLVPIYKLFGIALVIVTMIGLIAWIDYRQRQRGTPIRLDGPLPGKPGSESVEEAELQEVENSAEQISMLSNDDIANLGRTRLSGEV
jgi:UDP-GlcNAc:undecaprenyl-phosphate GlcNAc-1-phosphate transferase